MIKLAGVCVERPVDIAQAAFLPDVSKDHTCQLVPTLEMLAVVVSSILGGDALKLVAGEQSEKLGEDVGIARHWVHLVGVDSLPSAVRKKCMHWDTRHSKLSHSWGS